MQAIAELIEQNVVPREHGAYRGPQVQSVAVTPDRALPAVVVDETPRDFYVGVIGLVVERHPAVMHHQVDVPGVRRVVHDYVRPPISRGRVGGHAVGI